MRSSRSRSRSASWGGGCGARSGRRWRSPRWPWSASRSCAGRRHGSFRPRQRLPGADRGRHLVEGPGRVELRRASRVARDTGKPVGAARGDALQHERRAVVAGGAEHDGARVASVTQRLDPRGAEPLQEPFRLRARPSRQGAGQDEGPAGERRGGGEIRYRPPANDPTDYRRRPIQVFSEHYMPVTRASRATTSSSMGLRCLPSASHRAPSRPSSCAGSPAGRSNADGDQRTIRRSRNDAISSALKPTDAKISSVCSPSTGGGRR